MKIAMAVCALLALLLGVADTAGAAKKHKRPFCKPAHSKVLKQRKGVRIVYVTHPGGEYGDPATVYACVPHRHRRTKLFEIEEYEGWSPDVMRLTPRYFAFAATVYDIVCTKYDPGNPQCVSSYVASYRLSTGKERCVTGASATALALTSNGWIAWLEGSTLSACDSTGTRVLDDGSIERSTVRARGTSIEWKRDGQTMSAPLG
jgi:hypothetical protein